MEIDMKQYEFSRKIDIRYHVDTVVVGGGPAGTFAAISAGRLGAKTLLIEKNGILGGTMTVGGINFPGLFHAWGKQVISGPGWESVMRTAALGGAKIPVIRVNPEKHWYQQIRVNKALYTKILDDMCAESGVTVLFHVMLSAIEERADGVLLLVTGKDGLFGIEAKNVIDATGDGNVAVMAGYSYEISKEQQPATLTNRLGGYEFEKLNEELIRKTVSDALARGEMYSEISPDAILVWLHDHRFDMHLVCEGGADSFSKGEIEKKAREKVANLLLFLRRIPGLEGLTVEEMCNECGIRESRRIIGEKQITVADYVNAYRYKDAVCYAFYPVDLHVMDGIQKIYLEEGKVPTVPFGALVPKGSERLLICGRCVSSDALANSALRVQAVCMAMGQAAGCAAAVMDAKKITIRELQYEDICSNLRKIGAIVPQ